MKAFILTDMEGIAGVEDWEFAEGCRLDRGNELFAGEVMAAVAGCRAAGAAEVTVLLGHGTSRLPPSAEQTVTVLKMVDMKAYPFGLDASYDAMLFVGQHAMAGIADGHLSHSCSGIVKAITLNGREVGEFGLWAAIAGGMGIPVVFLSGDRAACREAEALVPGIVTVAVKTGVDKLHAVHLPHEEAKAAIHEGVRLALGRRGDIKPVRMASPLKLTFEFRPKRRVVQTCYLPETQADGLVRVSPTTIAIGGDDLVEMMNRNRRMKINICTTPLEE